MKRFKILFLFVGGLLLCFENVFAATNPYKKEVSWGGINCTWSAWQQTYNRTGVVLPGFGNAKDWYNDAKNAGFSVGNEPKANAIIVLDNYLDYGHVAFVDSVKNGNVYVWDSVPCYREMTKEEHDVWWDCIINNTTSADDSYKCDYLQVLEEIPCEYSKENGKLDKVVGYIYVTEPRKTVNNTNNKSSSNTKNENKDKEKVKSNNAYLSNLTIGDLKFDFDKNILKYSLVVSNDISSVKLEAKPEDNKAIVQMDNEVKLEVGDNQFNIIVIAEDKSTKNYIINIKRLEKDNQPILEEEPEKTEEKSKNGLVLIFASSVIVISIVGIILFIVRKKQKAKI